MKREKKRFVSILLVISLTVAMVAGCGSAGESGNSGDKDTVIAVSFANMYDKFITYVTAAMDKYVEEEHPEIELVYSDAANDSAKQLQNIENAISDNVDGIILQIWDESSGGPIMAQVNEAEIPLLVLDNYLDAAECYVGGDPYSAGYTQGKGIAEAIEGEGKILLLKGQSGVPNAEGRYEGNIDAFSEYPGIEVVEVQDANWDRAKAMEITENLIQSGMEFDTIVASSDEMAIGAGLAIEGQGVNREEYFIAGIDGLPDGLDAIKEGTIDMTFYMSVEEMAAQAIENTLKMMDGESVEKDNFLEYSPVSEENLDEVYEVWQPYIEATKDNN